MLKAIKVAASSALAMSLAWAGAASADLTQSVLDGIANGTRVNTKVTVPLSAVPVPEPSNLYDFVKDKQAAIELGKALFWDMQVGSDGVQACASCHFNAGADSRTKNQINPSVNIKSLDLTTGTLSDTPDSTFAAGTGPNYQLTADDFPLHKIANPHDFNSQLISDTNDVVSSQGVAYSIYAGADVDVIDNDGDGVADDPNGFEVPDQNGVTVNTRRVEPRNTPTVINAVFNVRNFWDGRASQIFNGVDPTGTANPHAYVYKRIDGELNAVTVAIDHGSLASQAMAPPLSRFEMSADGRTWVNVGDELTGRELSRDKGHRVRMLRPLASQLVARDDSVLGKYSAYPRPGLKLPNYDMMIRRAFHDQWWAASQWVHINEDGTRSIVQSPLGANTYSQMEMNFSLFFGLAVQLYQATLVSDSTRIDQYVATGDESLLTQDELVGFFIAHDEARCFNCHGGAETTFASFTRINERGMTRIRDENLIDEGFNNIGVRPTLEDLGVGGLDSFGNPLSFARMTHLGDFVNTTTNPSTGALVLDPTKAMNALLGADGAFKIPTLRNVELTAPYFHNGGVATLDEVIDFYFRGGDFREFLPNTGDDATDHPVQGFDAERRNQVLISGLGVLSGPNFNQTGQAVLDEADKQKLVALLKAFTDERVRMQKAPFDHPQLFIPNGHPGDHQQVTSNGDGMATDDFSQFIEIKMVGANGSSSPLPTFAGNLAD